MFQGHRCVINTARSAAAQALLIRGEVQESRHKVCTHPMIRNIKTEAHACHYAWTCSHIKGGVFPGASCGRGQQPFNCWYLDMTIDHSTEGNSVCKPSMIMKQTLDKGVLTIDLSGNTSLHAHTRSWRIVHTSTFSSYVQSETRSSNGEPWLPDKLSDL